MRAWKLRSTPPGHTCLDEKWCPRKAENKGVLACVAKCGRSQKWDYGEEFRTGFKTKRQAAMCGRTMQEYAGQKGVEGPLPAGHEGVPRGFGLKTGDHGDTADGAGDHGRPAQLSTDYGRSGLQTFGVFFPERWYL